MKSKRLLLIIIAFFLLTPKPVALADTVTYRRVLIEGAILYSDKTLLTPTFEVPYSYYVKIEGEFGETVKVSYNSQDTGAPVIIGYMRLSDLTPCDYTPTSPYSLIKVSTLDADVLFLDHTLQKPLFNIPKNETMFLYGKLKVTDKTLCYVYYGSKLGYVDEKALNSFHIPNNQDPILEPEPPETTPPSSETVSPLKSDALQIVIIVGISIITISIVYFLFRPQKNETHEQNDFLTDDET